MSFLYPMTHCKDGILYISDEGIVQRLRSVGEGIVDWEEALVILGEHSPDLSDKDVAEFERLAKVCEQKIMNGELMGIEGFNKLPFSDEDRIQSYKEGADYLRKIIKAKGLN